MIALNRTTAIIIAAQFFILSLLAESGLFHAQFLFKSSHGRRLAAAHRRAFAKTKRLRPRKQHALPRRHALAQAKVFG
jgi:hypothetical protein